MDRLLDGVEKYLLYIVLLAIPLVVLSIFPNPFDTSKLVILVSLVSLVLVVKAVSTIIKGAFELSTSSFDLPVLLVGLSYLLSAIMRTPNKMEAFFVPGTASVILLGLILYFLLNSSFKENKRSIGITLFLSATISSVITLFAASGILAKIPQLPAYVKDTNFSTLGGLFPLSLFLLTILPVGAVLLISEKEVAKKLFYTVSLAIVILALGFSVYKILPGKPASPSIAAFSTTWAVSIDTLKESPLLGIGPGNYLTAFNRFRPIAYNGGNLWAVRFTSGSDFFLTLLTETGLLGLAAFVLLTIALVKNLRQHLYRVEKLLTDEGSYFLSLAIAFVMLLIFPTSMPFVLLTFVVLALASKTQNKTVPVSPIFIVAAPVILAVAALAYFGGRAVLAEYKFKASLDALVKNDAKTTYDTMVETINLNPYVDRYHASYAQVNMALASSIAQKKDLTENDKNSVAQLIQQAIREGKATVTLNPSRSANWELLAGIYQQIMAFAQGSDQFAIQSFTQAVALDPINPNLRIALGGIYYSLGNYDDAINALQLATFAKPDLANAHYNLSAAYREKGDIEKAISEMNIVLSLVQKDSNDYLTAKAELEALGKRRPAKEAKGSETLTPPQKTQQIIKPPLELPKESTPPASP